jgi:AcrR family transcriptional regulator
MTKQKILDKALELFTEKGYVGASMGDIAEAVGIRKASLYAHYSGKESIFHAVFDRILEEYAAFINGLTDRSGKQSAAEILDTVFKTFIRYCKNNDAMYFWDRYYYYPPEFLKDYIEEKTEEANSFFIGRITEVFTEGIAEGEILKQSPRKPALAYYYLLIGLSMSVKLYEKDELEKVTADALEGFLAGIMIKKER